MKKALQVTFVVFFNQGSQQLQNLEEERISQMQDFMNKYNSHLSVIGPKLVKASVIGDNVLSGTMESGPILPVKLPISIDTMLNFDDYWYFDVKCKQTLKL